MAAATASLSSLCIVADDLSGAADCAAAFAGAAGPVPVLLEAAPPGAACLALDADSRAQDEAGAASVTGRIFGDLQARGLRHELLYKKIDSTLRGHVGAELAAALRAAPALAGAVVAPSFPAQGRTLAAGRLLVHGRRPEGPGQGGDLMAMLDASGLRPALLSPPFGEPSRLARRIESALAGGATALAVDAGNDDELACIAAALRQVDARLLAAGSAGLAHALAVHVSAGASGLDPSPDAARGPVLTIVGSFSPAAAAQVAQVERCGAAQALRLSPAQWLEPQHAPMRHRVAGQAADALAAGRNVLLAIVDDAVRGASRSLVRAMAAAAAPLVRLAGSCVLTGGDTARALFEAAGIARLDVTGELEPGVAIGRAAASPGRQFILKAGGFGDARALERAIRRFAPAAS